MERKDLSSNWRKLQASLNIGKSSLKSAAPRGVKRKRLNKESSAPATRPKRMAPSVNSGLCPDTEIGKYIAIDCEMVGVGPDPDSDSVLARVSIVNYVGDQIYDSYVKPKETVTDWRTHVSGIAPKHMIAARTLEVVQADVAQIMDGRILIGHAIRNDLHALLLSHPKQDIRDTARYPPYRKLAGGGSPRLKILASELLGLNIQAGEHSSIEDARATILLYQRDKDGFEGHHAQKFPTTRVPGPKSSLGEDDGVDHGSENRRRKKKVKKRKK